MSLEKFKDAFIAAQIKHIKKGFKAHLISYVCMNAIMVVANYLTTWNESKWALFSIAGWGFGVIVHYLSQVLPAEKSQNKMAAKVLADI